MLKKYCGIKIIDTFQTIDLLTTITVGKDKILLGYNHELPIFDKKGIIDVPVSKLTKGMKVIKPGMKDNTVHAIDNIDIADKVSIIPVITVDSDDHRYVGNNGFLMHNGSKKSKTKNNWSSSENNDILDRFKPTENKISNEANAVFDKNKNGNDVYQGDRIIDDYSKDTNDRINQMNNQSNDNTTGSINDVVDGTNNQYFKDKVETANQRLSDRIKNDAMFSGLGIGDTSQLVSRNLSDNLDSMYADQYNKDQDRRVNAYQSREQAKRLQQQNTEDALNASGKRDALRQMQLDANKSKFDETKNSEWNNINKLLQTYNALRSGTGTSNAKGTSTTTSSISSSPTDIVGGIGNLTGSIFGKAGLVSSMFSDERLKKDISTTGFKAIDNNGNSHDIVEYKFKGTDKPQLGLIAQDVMKVNPDIISKKNGLFTVDYSKIKGML